jgi:hypothetical protein
MPLDRFFIERNRASTNRIRALAARLSDVEMQRPVGEHWTVAIVLAHLAFWDRRMLYIPEIAIVVNDLSLPLWAAIPPREAARIAIETAEELGRRLEGFPAALLDEIHGYNERWVVRALHRGEHLDEVDRALNG